MGEDLSLSSLLVNMAQLGIEIRHPQDIIVMNNINEDETLQEETEEAVSMKRSLRKRSSSDDSLHRTRNRKILKPKKNTGSPIQFETEKEAKNFYLNINKKKIKLKPTILETIYEQDETLSDDQQLDESLDKPTGKKKTQAAK